MGWRLCSCFRRCSSCVRGGAALSDRPLIGQGDPVSLCITRRASTVGSAKKSGPFVRYISTRGEAPSLGFIDVTLAGLARDGGLYVPDAWPSIDAATIAGFAGRPYAEVACDVIARFAVGELDADALSRMAREAYDA